MSGPVARQNSHLHATNDGVYSRVDSEFARLAIALGWASELRLWLLGRRGAGHVAIADLQQLAGYTPQHFNRLLRAGEGVFWQRVGDRLYMRSIVNVACALTLETIETGRPELVETNPPGVRPISIDLSLTGSEFKAEILGAWFAHRENATISNATLAMLFGTDVRTIQRWKAGLRNQGKLSERENLAQTTNNDEMGLPVAVVSAAEDNPDRLQRYNVVNSDGEIENRLSWRTPNTYIASADYRQHRRGQASKVRKAVNAILRDHRPANQRHGGQRRKAYYHDDKRFQRSKKANRVKGYGYAYIGYNERLRRNVWDYRATICRQTDVYEHFCHPHMASIPYSPANTSADQPDTTAQRSNSRKNPQSFTPRRGEADCEAIERPQPAPIRDSYTVDDPVRTVQRMIRRGDLDPQTIEALHFGAVSPADVLKSRPEKSVSAETEKLTFVSSLEAVAAEIGATVTGVTPRLLRPKKT